MKILRKRAIAVLIDSFFVASVLVLLQELLNYLNVNIGNWDVLIVLLFFIRDFIFRNASIGKKILGLKVYDKNWRAPGFLTLFKRSIVISTVGFVLLWKAKFVDGCVINFFDYEQDKFGTRVVDKKNYNRLKAEAEGKEGDFSKNMTELYNFYLKSEYMK